MSNVLIGIIGVVLFIGLALAGALLLGDDFKSANNDTKGAAVVQAMNQTANAVQMYKLKTGGTKRAENLTDTSQLIPRFMKVAPVNPVTNTPNIILGDVWGNASSGAAVGVIMPLGDTDEAKNVCESIQRQSGQIAPTAPFDSAYKNLQAATWTTETGCVKLWNGIYYGIHKL